MKQILKPGRNCWGIFEVQESGLLVDARNFYRAFYQAAGKAQHYILMAGWQFDSSVHLLKGEDLKDADGDVRLLPFLNELCEKNLDLKIYILAWDFSLLLSLSREWFQDWIFNWTATERIYFRFDSRHAIGASHHQKLIVIDGLISFIGGLDVCANRWDNRDHQINNPDRINPEGKPYDPYHDIQSYHTGPVVEKLVELFSVRWEHAGGSELDLPQPDKNRRIKIEPTISMTADRIAISRTEAKLVFPMQNSIQEIRSLYMDAIEAADKLIYIENQYFTSQAVYKALIDRMKALYRPPLQIVIILPKKPHALLEEIALGIAQVKILHSLIETAFKNGHSLGVYYPATSSEDGTMSPTYIHAKLILIDDRFLSLGSANISNRSMGLDTELNVSWEADSEQQEDLFRSIREVRVDLLSEHTGIGRSGERQSLVPIENLVNYLNHLADHPHYRLHHHTMETLFEGSSWLKDVKPEDLAIDPEKPIVEETIYELISHEKSGLFYGGISWLGEWLSIGSKKAKEEEKKESSSEKGAARLLQPEPDNYPEQDAHSKTDIHSEPRINSQVRFWFFLLIIFVLIALLMTLIF